MNLLQSGWSTCFWFCKRVLFHICSWTAVIRSGQQLALDLILQSALNILNPRSLLNPRWGTGAHTEFFSRNKSMSPFPEACLNIHEAEPTPSVCLTAFLGWSRTGGGKARHGGGEARHTEPPAEDTTADHVNIWLFPSPLQLKKTDSPWNPPPPPHQRHSFCTPGIVVHEFFTKSTAEVQSWAAANGRWRFPQLTWPSERGRVSADGKHDLWAAPRSDTALT